MQTTEQNQPVDVKSTEVISQILKFTEYLETNFYKFKENIVDANYQRETPPKPIYDIFSHLYKAKQEVESVANYCKNYLSSNIKLTKDELSLLIDSVNDRIDNGVRVNNMLATDKIDLQPLYNLKNKLIQDVGEKPFEAEKGDEFPF
jgi:hypothetical protein